MSIWLQLSVYGAVNPNSSPIVTRISGSNISNINNTTTALGSTLDASDQQIEELQLADYDNDGFQDISVTSRVQNKVYFNDGNNVFTQVNLPGASMFSSQAVADFNGD